MNSVSLLVLLSVLPMAAPDKDSWPGWRGSDRTGVTSTETGLLKQWPEGGPKLAWKSKGLGTGFSTPSITGGKIYLLGTKSGGDEYLYALETTKGEKIWEAKIGKETGGHPGPRSTPTIDAGFAYAISSDGNLICAEVMKGEIKWKKNLKTDFGGRTGNWAYAESPLIDGDLLICTPGGQGSALVALKKSDGELVWKSSIEGLKGQKRAYSTAGYSSPIVTTIAGVKQYVQFLDGGLVGVDAKDGKLLWHYDAPANGTANCSTPLVQGEFVFAASAYGNGGGQAKITKDGENFKAEQTYFVKKMQNHHGGMLLLKDHIYGTGGGSLLCVDFKKGEIAWEDRSVGKGSVAYADGMLYVRGENGKVALVEANPAKYVEKGQFTQPDRSPQPAWAHPVIVGGKMYLRDWDILLCYEVK